MSCRFICRRSTGSTTRSRCSVFAIRPYSANAAPQDDVAVALAASLLVDTCTLSHRAAQAWVTTLPLGLDLARVQRTFDTTALATAFPFDPPQLPAADPAQANRPQGACTAATPPPGCVRGPAWF